MLKSVIDYLLEGEDYRYKSIQNIPKTNNSLLDTILYIIDYIQVNNPTLEIYNEWFSNKFSKNRNYNYNTRKTLERANVITVKSDRKLYLTSDILRVIYNIDKLKLSITLGFLELYQGMIEILYTCYLFNLHKRAEIYIEWDRRYSKQMIVSRNSKSQREQFGIMIRYLKDFGLISINENIIKVNSTQLKIIGSELNNRIIAIN